MSYRHAFAVGWAIAWRVFAYSAVFGFLMLLVLIIFRSVPTSDTARGWVFYGLNVLLNVFVVLPLGVRDAVLQEYSDFRVFVASTAHHGGGLTYFESLQPSLLIFLIQGASVWLLHLWHLSLSEPFMLPLFLALLNPVIAAIAIHIPFLGFRISIVPNSPTVS